MNQLTAREIERRLERKYLVEQGGWVFLREVAITDAVVLEEWQRRWASENRWNLDRPGELANPMFRRIDVLLISRADKQPTPFERIAIEIKISRADFRRDTETKRRAWQAVAHRFAYATPTGLIKPEEVPAGCGLIEVDPDPMAGYSGVNWKVRAPRRTEQPEPFTDRFVAYLAGRASRAEALLRAGASS